MHGISIPVRSISRRRLSTRLTVDGRKARRLFASHATGRTPSSCKPSASTRSEVDIDNDIDWHERHVLLKAAFPLAATSDFATYEIPYGSIQRPTTRNNSWEKAQFEVPAMRWADLSGTGPDGKVHGMSLLNQAKYGYDAVGNMLRLTLLRSPTWPDPEADQGRSSFPLRALSARGHLERRAHRAPWMGVRLSAQAVVTTAHAGLAAGRALVCLGLAGQRSPHRGQKGRRRTNATLDLPRLRVGREERDGGVPRACRRHRSHGDQSDGAARRRSAYQLRAMWSRCPFIRTRFSPSGWIIRTADRSNESWVVRRGS